MTNGDMDVMDLLQRAGRAVLGRPLPELTPESHLAAAGFDSVAMLEMVAWIEDETGLSLPDDEVVRVATVADVAALLARTQRAAVGT